MTFLKYFQNTLRVYLLQKDKSYFHILFSACFNEAETIKQWCGWVRNQFFVALCEDQYLVKHGQSRRLPKFANEPIKQYRERILRAYEFYRKSGTREGIKNAIGMVTEKAFDITFLNSDGWVFGQSVIGHNNILGGDDTNFRFHVDFKEQLTADELSNINWILMKVKGARDIYFIFEPTVPVVYWEIGESKIGIDNILS